MKILMLSPQPFFEPRGTPISVYQRLEALSTLGHHIDLITYPVGKDAEFPNVRIHRVRKVKRIQHDLMMSAISARISKGVNASLLRKPSGKFVQWTARHSDCWN